MSFETEHAPHALARETEHERLAREGMYRPEFEGDACGVGMVAAIDGQASRRVVQSAIDALKAVAYSRAYSAFSRGIIVAIAVANSSAKIASIFCLRA